MISTYEEDKIIFAVIKNANMLKSLTKEQRTHKVKITAVKNSSWALNLIPSEERSLEVIETSILASASSIRYLSKKERTKELIELAFFKNVAIIEYLTPEERTEEMNKKAIQENSYHLNHLAKEERTEEIKKLALSRNGNSICYLDDDEITKELIEIAVKRDSTSIRYISEENRYEELNLLAVSSKAGYVINYLSKEERTDKVKELAVKSNPSSIKYFSLDEITENIIALFPHVAFPQNASILAKAYILKNNLYQKNIFSEIPLMKELQLVNFRDDEERLNIFRDIGKEYIENKVFPYIDDYFTWMFASAKNIASVYYTTHNNHLAAMIFEGCLRTLDTMLQSKRRKYMTKLRKCLLNTSKYNENQLVLINRYPEFKLKFINK